MRILGYLAIPFLVCACLHETEKLDESCVQWNAQALYGAGNNALTQTPDLVLHRRAIGALENKLGILYCTGVLVHPDYVLTAAHCVDEGTDLVFRLAADGDDGARVALGDAVIHPEADLALLEVLEPELLRAARVAPCPMRLAGAGSELSEGASVLLAGVGQRDDGGHGTLEFLEEHVSALDQSSVTVDGQGKTGACRGDSGGPLMVRTADATNAIAGVLSTGDTSCRGHDTYVRLDEHADWLRVVLDLPEATCEQGP